MTRLPRFIFVLPLVLATCAVAILNGGVLCIARGDHFAVEARHEPGGCTASAPCPGHDDAEPMHDECSDVSAEFDLLRADSRSSVDAATSVALCLCAAISSQHNPGSLAVSPYLVCTSPPPSLVQTAVITSVVLIL